MYGFSKLQQAVCTEFRCKRLRTCANRPDIPESKLPLGRPRHRWEGNIKMYKINRLDMDWINLACGSGKWRAVSDAVMDFRFPQNAGNLLSSLGTSSFSRRTVLCGVG